MYAGYKIKEQEGDLYLSARNYADEENILDVSIISFFRKTGQILFRRRQSRPPNAPQHRANASRYLLNPELIIR